MKPSAAVLALPLFVVAVVAVACSGVSLPTDLKVSVSSNVAQRTTVTGKVKSLDTTKETLVLDVAGKDQTFTLTADTNYRSAGKIVLRADAAKTFVGKSDVDVTTEKKDGKDVTVEVKMK